MAITISSGADHSMFMKLAKSARRAASTDIKFTISPAVDCLLEALFRTRAFEKQKVDDSQNMNASTHHNIIKKSK